MKLLKELHSINTRILNNIATEHDCVLNSKHPCYFPSAESICTGLGRPRLWVSAVEINQFYGVYRSWKDVSLDIGVSVRTPERRRNISNIWQNWKSCSTYAVISNERLCAVLREVWEILPDAGETYIIGTCHQRNNFVQRKRIRDAINTVDPVSSALQKSICIMSRVYCVLALNSLW